MGIKQVIKNLTNVLTDRQYLSLRYYLEFRRPIHWENPRTFNEKMQWLKLYDRDPLYPRMVDKYSSKQLVSDAIGEEYIIPCLGIWNSFEEIDFGKLPPRFVLKTTHDCGGVLVCRNKSDFVQETDSGWTLTERGAAASRIMNENLKKDYYFQSREWPYHHVPHRILAEEYVENPGQDCLIVYKVFCFGGEPELIQVIQDDKSDLESIDYFDCGWNLLPLRQNYPNSTRHLEKPEVLEEMLALSRTLAANRAFIRVDWYIVEGKLKFSEFTLYSDAGMAPFVPESWDLHLGEKILLPQCPSGDRGHRQKGIAKR